MVEQDVLGTQRRSRRIAMTAGELDAFLTEQRVCRVATLTASGAPHNAPLWFVWDGTCLWLYSIVKSQRWTDVMGDARVSVVVDAGNDFFELHGVELRGSLEQVGEVPRTGGPEDDPYDDPELEAAERLFAPKYLGKPDGPMHHDGRHAWLRLRPEKIASWDHRKI
jgi:pyridoxamine 5'-phosphate oxidase-like protein